MTLLTVVFPAYENRYQAYEAKCRKSDGLCRVNLSSLLIYFYNNVTYYCWRYYAVYDLNFRTVRLTTPEFYACEQDLIWYIQLVAQNNESFFPFDIVFTVNISIVIMVTKNMSTEKSG